MSGFETQRRAGNPPAVEEQRRALKNRRIEAPHKHRILYIGRFAFGLNDIVSCLLRALRNLGHPVFYLNTDRHPEILDNPHGKQGGFGPIFVRPQRFAGVLREFDPEVVICCAGGYVFEAQDAASLKAQGRLLLGMTLSDPDVLDSVKGHVQHFDCHTTNALQALALYRRAGIANTVYFPFGIDRDFVEAEVHVPPVLQADVICLGQGRPERNRAMKALAERFAVKVYGSGWELPGIGQVAGLKMLQASRGGRIHVNFPGTVAGHINVKCGVFESIASGALLCTAEFDEMRRFFEYGEEIVGYADADGLIITLERLLEDPQRLETMRRRAFRRLLDEHLYEYRWLQLFESDALQAVLLERRGRPAVEPPARPKEILLAPLAQADALLDLLPLARALQTAGPALRPCLVSAEPGEWEKRYGLAAVDAADDNALHRSLAGCDGVVFVGGQWHDRDFAEAGEALSLFHGAGSELARSGPLALLAALYCKALLFYGVGVERLRSEGAQCLLRFVAAQASEVMVSDERAREALQALPGWRAPLRVRVAADPAFAYPLGDEPASEPLRSLAAQGPVLLINVCPWDGHDERAFYERLAVAIDGLPGSERLSVVGVGAAGDHDALQALLARLRKPPRKAVLDWGGDYAVLGAGLRAASALFAMRRSLSLLAYRVATPSLALSGLAGVAALYRQLGHGERCLPPAANSAVLAAALAAVLAQGRLDSATRERVAALEDRARRDLESLGQRLSGLPHAPKVRIVGELTRPSLAAVAPAGAPGFNLAYAEIEAGNLHRRGRIPPHSQTLSAAGLSFQFSESAPRKGDYLRANLALRAEPGQRYRVRLALHQPYAHRNMENRIVYQVLVEGREFVEEDIADWSEANTVSLFAAARAPTLRVAVRLLALRDCEPWGWGRASLLTLKKVTIEPCPQGPEAGASAESPYTRVFPRGRPGV